MKTLTVKINGKNGKSYKAITSLKNVSLAMCGDYNGSKVGSICEMPVSVVKYAYDYGTTKLGFPKDPIFESTFNTFGSEITIQWTNGVRVVPDKDF